MSLCRYEHPIKGQGIYAYVSLAEGQEMEDSLKKELVTTVRGNIGAFAAPDVIHWAPGLPKTRSGKIMRRVSPYFLLYFNLVSMTECVSSHKVVPTGLCCVERQQYTDIRAVKMLAYPQRLYRLKFYSQDRLYICFTSLHPQFKRLDDLLRAECHEDQCSSRQLVVGSLLKVSYFEVRRVLVDQSS